MQKDLFSYGTISSLKSFKFIDLFAGIGGFHIAAERLGGKCVLACEIDEFARKTYLENYKIDEASFPKDITSVLPENIPDHDVLCAGFPCQPFSQAGLKKWFEDIRGTLFFNIANIIKVKKPPILFLENVRHLLKHNEGATFARIKEVIEGLGYQFYHKIVYASDHGLPQHRPRLFMIGLREDLEQPFSWPDKEPLRQTMSDILGGNCPKQIGFTLRVGGRGSSITDRRNWDSYWVDDEVKRITPKEGLKMQGFPESFKFPVSQLQAMKQLGNSVAISAIYAVLRNALAHLKEVKDHADKNSE